MFNRRIYHPHSVKEGRASPDSWICSQLPLPRVSVGDRLHRMSPESAPSSTFFRLSSIQGFPKTGLGFFLPLPSSLVFPNHPSMLPSSIEANFQNTYVNAHSVHRNRSPPPSLELFLQYEFSSEPFFFRRSVHIVPLTSSTLGSRLCCLPLMPTPDDDAFLHLSFAQFPFL